MKTRKTIDVENIAYKFRILPEAIHIDYYFPRWFGCRRFLWNRMLADKSDFYKIMGFDLKNEVTDYKDVYAFLNEVDSLVLANTKLDLSKAFEYFFKGKAHYPRFKKKSSRQTFTTNIASTGAKNLRYDEGSCLLKLPKIKEPVRVVQHRKIKAGGILKSATISRDPDGRYYASLLYEYPKPTMHTSIDKSKSVGLDMSMEHFFVDHNGDATDYPRFYRAMESRLAKEQAKLSLMKKGSNNYRKQKHRIAKLHAKIKHQRSDFLHKLSYNLVQNYDIICIEDLNMRAMSRSLDLGKSVHDLGWGMFVSMLEYKCRKFGKVLIKVDRFFPSSKTCGACGYVNKGLKLSDRLYVCPKCGHLIDRDWQAAINILDEGLRIYNDNLVAA